VVLLTDQPLGSILPTSLGQVLVVSDSTLDGGKVDCRMRVDSSSQTGSFPSQTGSHICRGESCTCCLRSRTVLEEVRVSAEEDKARADEGGKVNWEREWTRFCIMITEDLSWRNKSVVRE